MVYDNWGQGETVSDNDSICHHFNVDVEEVLPELNTPIESKKRYLLWRAGNTILAVVVGAMWAVAAMIIFSR